MAGHVVRTFQGMGKVVGVFRNQPRKKTLEVPTRGRIGIFEKEQAGAGVPNKNVGQAGLYLAGPDQFRHFPGDFVGSFSFGAKTEFRTVGGKHSYEAMGTSGRTARPW